MKTESSYFRILPDHKIDYSFRMTRSEFISQLRKYDIHRSWNWPYTLKQNQEQILTNSFNKIIKVKREWPY